VNAKPSTRREFERFLRERGYSKAEARRLAGAFPTDPEPHAFAEAIEDVSNFVRSHPELGIPDLISALNGSHKPDRMRLSQTCSADRHPAVRGRSDPDESTERSEAGGAGLRGQRGGSR